MSFPLPILSFVNHLLAAEAWATTRLRPFAGQHVRFELGPLKASAVVRGDGSLADGVDGALPAVTIQLADDAPLQLLVGRADWLAAARISGAADFADALGFVARNLRWDAEADLARVLGDIPAHRISRLGTHALATVSDTLQRLRANFGEFLEGETASVIRSTDMADFSREVKALRDEVERLEQRIGRR